MIVRSEEGNIIVDQAVERISSKHAGEVGKTLVLEDLYKGRYSETTTYGCADYN